MKKSFYLLGMAAIMMAGCTSDEFVGEMSADKSGAATDGRISFMGRGAHINRASLIGDAAATKLGNKFLVYGTKHVSAAENGTATNDITVFDNYQVEYATGTTSTTNTKGWEYDSKTAYSTAITELQTVKYWDFGAAEGYTFYAFSGGDNISYPQGTTDALKVTKTTTGSDKYAKGYTCEITNAAKLENIYFADRVEVAKTSYDADRTKPVTFTFRSFGSRVRVGFYETVPGYDVKIVKFRVGDGSAEISGFANMTTDNTANFAAAVKHPVVDADGATFNVTYSDGTIATADPVVPINQAMFGPLTDGGEAYTLTLGTNVFAANLLETAAAPTFDQAGGLYTSVFPNANPGKMLIKVDYDLISKDNSADIIHVKNARVVVPAEYLTWKSNHAYTYLFKISDNTNGTTGEEGVDVEGLYPITFDAQVVEEEDGAIEEGTVSTVSTPVITTYQSGSTSESGIAYATVKGDIYVTVTDGTATVDLSGTDAIKLYSVQAGTTEADLMLDAPTTAATTIAVGAGETVGSAEFVVNKYAKLTLTTAGTYAVQYNYGTDQHAYKIIVVNP